MTLLDYLRLTYIILTCTLVLKEYISYAFEYISKVILHFAENVIHLHLVFRYYFSPLYQIITTSSKKRGTDLTCLVFSEKNCKNSRFTQGFICMKWQHPHCSVVGQNTPPIRLPVCPYSPRGIQSLVRSLWGGFLSFFSSTLRLSLSDPAVAPHTSTAAITPQIDNTLQFTSSASSFLGILAQIHEEQDHSSKLVGIFRYIYIC